MGWCIRFFVFLLRAVILTMVLFFVVFGLMMTASTWSGILFPVAKVEITRGYWDGDDYVMEGFLDKYRSCEFLGMTWRHFRTGLEYNVTTPRRPSGQAVSRPAVDNQPFINWRMIDAPKHGGLFNIYAQHRCHELWDTFTELGSTTIPGKGDTE